LVMASIIVIVTALLLGKMRFHVERMYCSGYLQTSRWSEKESVILCANSVFDRGVSTVAL
jgi:hypothetical protein